MAKTPHRLSRCVVAAAVAATIVCAAMWGCHRPTAPVDAVTSASAPVPSASSSSSSSSSSPASASVAPATDNPLAKLPFQILVGAELWALGATALDQLSVADQAKPAALLARARVGVGVCSVAQAEASLKALDALVGLDFPEKSRILGVVSHLRVDAQVCAGKWDEALAAPSPHGLPFRSTALGFRTLASAFEAKSEWKSALSALDHAIDLAPKAGLSVPSLHQRRLFLLEKLGDDALTALQVRRLFLEFPQVFDRLPNAVARAALLTPSLDQAAWLRRAHTLASQGRGDDAVAAVGEAERLGAPARLAARERGNLLYRAKSYSKAVSALDASSGLCDKDGHLEEAAADAFHAARATSRSGNDDEAIRRYDNLLVKYPRSHAAREAGFLAANLRHLHGKWSESIVAFGKFLRDHGKDEHSVDVREARRALAISLLEDGRYRDAQRAFTKLEIDLDKNAREGRFELLAAIAQRRAGDDVKGVFARLRDEHPLRYVDLAARTRLTAVSVSSSPWTARTRPATNSRLSSHIILLKEAGLLAQARVALLAEVGKGADCADHASLEDGASSFRLGAKGESCAFPSPHAQVVDTLEDRDRLPRGLMFAVIRQESAFREEVVSPAGAIGIAQLMPATAAATAKEIGLTLDPDDVAAISSVGLQLDLAARHLRFLYDELAGKGASDEARRAVTPLVIAAYNGGVGSVKRWLAEAPALDADVFVERMPFVETRTYVVRVLGNHLRYALMGGGTPPVMPNRFSLPPTR